MDLTILLPVIAISLCATGVAAAERGDTAHLPRWIKMPILSPEQKRTGISPGGEGAQWPRGPVAVSPADPSFLLLPIDVGGLYRSLDAGKHWGITMSGWNARGANGFAIDPRNAGRAIGIAANSMNWDMKWGPTPNGLYLSTDKAASWKQVLPTVEGFEGRLTYDPTSFDEPKGCCTRIFYLSADHGLFRSEDAGETWGLLPDAPQPGHNPDGDWTNGKNGAPMCIVRETTGEVFVGGRNGLYRSADHGKSWRQLRSDPVHSLSTHPDGTLYFTDPAKIQVSRDGGESWQALKAEGLTVPAEQWIQNLVVSPADPKCMLCWTTGDRWQWPRYYSHDGGDTFHPVTTERDGAVLPLNGRQGYFTWDPADPNIAYCIGGDWVTKSADGGKTFRWSNNGYNGVMAGGSFCFSTFNPDVVLITFQDYNGAFTADGGATWNYRDISGLGWGGHEYSAFALNRSVMWTGDAESWGTPRRLRITLDGGDTWHHVPGPDGKPLEVGKAEHSHGDPGDANVGFAGSLRTADAGETWARMAGCDAVYTYDPTTLELYGKSGRRW